MTQTIADTSTIAIKDQETMFRLVGLWILSHVCHRLQHFGVVDLGVGSRGRNVGVEDGPLQDCQVNALLDSGSDVVAPETVGGYFFGEASGPATSSKRLGNRPNLQPSGLGEEIARCDSVRPGNRHKEGARPRPSPADRPMTDDPQTFSRDPASALASAFSRHYLDMASVEIDMPQIEGSHRSDPEPGGEQDGDNSGITGSGSRSVEGQCFSQGEDVGPGQTVHIGGSPRSIPGILDSLDLSPDLRVHLARPGQAACDLFQGSRQESGTGAIRILLLYETEKQLDLIGRERVPRVLENRRVVEAWRQISQSHFQGSHYTFPAGRSESGEIRHDRILTDIGRELTVH